MKDGGMQVGPNVVVEVTIHDLMAKNKLRGVGRRYLWHKYLNICCQMGIYYHTMGEWLNLNSKLPINLACWTNEEHFAF